MLKGISRQIVEITDTGNPYFERALLVVRTGCSDCSPEIARREAERLIRANGTYSGLRRARRHTFLQRIGLMSAGGALTLLLYRIILLFA